MVHDPDVGIDQDDARQLLIWTKTFLYDCELLGKVESSTPAEDPDSKEKCQGCDGLLEVEWNYCPSCGQALKLVCSNCNRKLEDGQKLCGWCGTPVRVLCSEEKHASIIEYRSLCKSAWFDGVVNIRERELMEQKRLALGLSDTEAHEIEEDIAPRDALEYTHLVEGVLFGDGIITEQERHFLNEKKVSIGLDAWVAKEIEDALCSMIGNQSE